MRPNSKSTSARTPAYRQAIALAGAIVVNAASCAYAANAPVVRHNLQQLQQQQLQDTLDLNLRQSTPRRANLSPSDALRLDQLQLRQRMELQQLEQQQLQQERLSRNRDFPNPVLEQRQLAQERQLQIQRFDLEQRELLRSMQSQPLQRQQPAGQLLP